MRQRILKDLRLAAPFALGLLTVCLFACFYFAQYWPDPPIGTNPQSYALSYAQDFQTFAWLLWILLPLPAVAIFGSEYSFRTFERLVSQPISRSRLWGEKMLSLSLIYLIPVLLVLGICIALRSNTLSLNGTFRGVGVPNYPIYIREVSRSLTGGFVLVLSGLFVAFGGGPLLTLYLRTTQTAYWAALVLPIGMMLLLYPFFENFLSVFLRSITADTSNGSILLYQYRLGVLLFSLPYLLITLALARRRLLRLEV